MRPSSALTPNKMQKIQTKIDDTPGTSEHKLMAQTYIPRATVFWTLKLLQLHVYRAILVQELLPPDSPCCLAFYKSVLQFVYNSDCFFFNFSDEAWFHHTGYINACNYRFWFSKNLHHFHKTSFHQGKICVCCVISWPRVVGYIFSHLL